jgi:hypothetical protein
MSEVLIEGQPIFSKNNFGVQKLFALTRIRFIRIIPNSI